MILQWGCRGSSVHSNLRSPLIFSNIQNPIQNFCFCGFISIDMYTILRIKTEKYLFLSKFYTQCGVKLTALRSRVTCITNWVSQAPQNWEILKTRNIRAQVPLADRTMKSPHKTMPLENRTIHLWGDERFTKWHLSVIMKTALVLWGHLWESRRVPWPHCENCRARSTPIPWFYQLWLLPVKCPEKKSPSQCRKAWPFIIMGWRSPFWIIPRPLSTNYCLSLYYIPGSA